MGLSDTIVPLGNTTAWRGRNSWEGTHTVLLVWAAMGWQVTLVFTFKGSILQKFLFLDWI